MASITSIKSKLQGKLAALRMKVARASGERGDETVLQGIMERMYAEANHARAYQLGKVKAAQQASDLAESNVHSQLLNIKAQQKRLGVLHDVAATRLEEHVATHTSAEQFLKLLPTPGVSK